LLVAKRFPPQLSATDKKNEKKEVLRRHLHFNRYESQAIENVADMDSPSLWPIDGDASQAICNLGPSNKGAKQQVGCTRHRTYRGSQTLSRSVGAEVWIYEPKPKLNAANSTFGEGAVAGE